jgi:hypothetical protein
LLAGLGLALPPQHGAGVTASLRWAAAAIAFVAWFGEVLGLAFGYSSKSYGAPAAVRRRYCPECQMVLTHRSYCRYRASSVAEAWKRYRDDRRVDGDAAGPSPSPSRDVGS